METKTQETLPELANGQKKEFLLNARHPAELVMCGNSIISIEYDACNKALWLKEINAKDFDRQDDRCERSAIRILSRFGSHRIGRLTVRFRPDEKNEKAIKVSISLSDMQCQRLRKTTRKATNKCLGNR